MSFLALLFYRSGPSLPVDEVYSQNVFDVLDVVWKDFKGMNKDRRIVSVVVVGNSVVSLDLRIFIL